MERNLSKKTVLFESKKLYENQIPLWIKNYVKELGFSIDDKSSKILSDYLGSDLSKISNEISKTNFKFKYWRTNLSQKLLKKILE